MRLSLRCLFLVVSLGLSRGALAQDGENSLGSGIGTDVVLEGTFRGAHGDGPSSDNRWGLGVAVGFPVKNGLDLGVAWGQMFRDGGTLHWDARARLFLSDIRSGLYLGAGYVSNGEDFGYGTLGYQISFLYGEMDFLSGDDRPVDMVPEFGLRFRF